MCGPKRFSEDIDGCNEKKSDTKMAYMPAYCKRNLLNGKNRLLNRVYSPASQALNAADLSVLTMVSSLVGGFSFTSTRDLE